MSATVLDWVSWILGINQVANNSAILPTPAPGSASPPRILNFLPPLQATYNSGANSFDVSNGPAPTMLGSSSYAVVPGDQLYVDLDTVGSSVVLTTTSLGIGNAFSVKLIGSNAGNYTLTIDPITSGSHIESRSAPGTLTTSFVMSQIGDSITLRSPNGTDLYY